MVINNRTCFVLLPGFAPDNYPVLASKRILENMGYQAVAANFWGVAEVKDYSQLTIEQCKKGITDLITDLSQRFESVIGIGISLGGALLLEYAKGNGGLNCIVSIGTPFKLKKRKLIHLGLKFYPILNWWWEFMRSLTSRRWLPIGASKMVVKYLEGDFLRNLEKIRTPVLLLHSKDDYLTDYRVLEDFIVRFSSDQKKIILLENVNHGASHDINDIMKFLIDL